jgi:dTDP-4-dehydrorhamnose reductase
MVGRAVIEYCESQGDDVFSYDHQALDISDESLVRQTLASDRPEAVINCAAWTDVDGCERNPVLASAANAQGPENLAKASRQLGAILVTISTDYVFDGEKEGFYTQRDDPNPKSVYGVSKLEGERRAQQASARTVIVRSGFIFGAAGRNFLSTVADRARSGGKLSAIRDAWGTPTYSAHLAARLRELAARDLPGIYHVVNAGDGASYEEFTRLVVAELGGEQATVQAVTMDSLKRPAPRPRNSRLRCLLSDAIGLDPLPDWQDALRDFVVGNRPAGATN